ncbi:GNAT family N-acetyltransferase [Entomomonas asaccharolytica]|uniref:GNAT family N-acetyltransferase n=1 Tax=Entomomonas asaccharolytica TaxID=2785331 RepID=A0A974NFN3_9GAMM|nr:GNAT family N-acetyltransferase [Entomomonas asaccharolytica]QQP85617.1 GNAT family N-acetyltransferase [Entomomonas asaccharolytica]
MQIQPVLENKKSFLDLLLLADEQESMIDKYLERGDMFALYDEDLKSICVVTQESTDLYEIKNIATVQKYQGQGYGKALIHYVLQHYKNKCKAIQVGTGESDLTIPFYESCGFSYSHKIANFFIDNYDHPIFDRDKQLIDMVYLKIVL